MYFHFFKMNTNLLHKYYQILESNSWESYIPDRQIRLYEAASYIMNLGGKRLRPIAVLLGCDLFEGDLQEAIGPAWAIELFHNFTLAHDDIMDHAETRRGKPSMHSKYGTEQAIISGDALMILAYQAFEKLSPDQYKTTIQTFSKAALEICEGQQLDMDFEKERVVSLEVYQDMIRGKTSALLGAALKIGALLGNAKEKEALELYEIGEQVGLAFQIKDDWLDAFGDQQKVGKIRGGDFIQRKKSIPWIIAHQDANKQQLSILDHWLDKSDEIILEDVYGVMTELDVSDKTEALSSQILLSVQSKIQNLNLSDPKKAMLNQWCEMLVNRRY